MNSRYFTRAEWECSEHKLYCEIGNRIVELKYTTQASGDMYKYAIHTVGESWDIWSAMTVEEIKKLESRIVEAIETARKGLDKK